MLLEYLWGRFRGAYEEARLRRGDPALTPEQEGAAKRLFLAGAMCVVQEVGRKEEAAEKMVAAGVVPPGRAGDALAAWWDQLAGEVEELLGGAAQDLRAREAYDRARGK